MENGEVCTIPTLNLSATLLPIRAFLRSLVCFLRVSATKLPIRNLPGISLSEDFASEKDYESLLKHSDDQAHFILSDGEDADKIVVVHWIEKEDNGERVEKIVQFLISGDNHDLFEMIKGCHCVQSDKLANNDLDALKRRIWSQRWPSPLNAEPI
eukprot:scaffold323_cov74-Skeletonema_dohrnii-CCMP3373.AAC.8